jgi:hypothetical protein
MSASSIKEYFRPLNDWLTTENAKADDCYGWGYDGWPPAVLAALPTPRCARTLPD